MNKISSVLKKLTGILLGIIILSFSWNIISWRFAKSDYCNYVRVENEKNFTGEWLKFSEAIENKILTKSECEKNDVKFDRGNGNKNGVVRWADCLAGPDCNEAGMF